MKTTGGTGRGPTQFADALRGIACACVVYSHVVGLGSGSGAAYADRILVKAADALPFIPFADLGKFGVALFFLVSGFVIPHSTVRYGPVRFLIARWWRIAPTYWACLGILLAAIAVDGWLFGLPLFPFPIAKVMMHFVVGLRPFLNSSSIDQVVWTLEIEIVFYCLCAAYVGAAGRVDRSIFLAGAIFFALAWAGSFATRRWSLYPQAPFLMFMLCGVALNCHFRGILSANRAALATAAFFGLFAFAARDLGSILCYGSALGVFTGTYLARAWPGFGWRPLSALAAINYPLYLVHWTPAFVVIHYLSSRGASNTEAILAAAAIVLLLSIAVHHLVELPTHEIGRRFALGQPSAALQGGSYMRSVA